MKTAKLITLRTVLLSTLLISTPIHISAAEKICGYKIEARIHCETTGGYRSFRAGVAETQAELSKGLMGCRDLKKDEGLIFLFKDESRRFFWMKNTPLPLSIIFMDSSFRVVSVKKGTPWSLKSVTSDFPARYVLEIPFDEKIKINPGNRCTLEKLSK